MSRLIARDISEKLAAVPGYSQEYVEVVSSLWSRWFTSLAMRTGTTADGLYSAVDVEIDHVDSIASRIGKELEIPASLKRQSSVLPFLSNQERIDEIQKNIASPPDAAEALDTWLQNSALRDQDGQPLVFYHGSFADIETFSEQAIGNNNRLGQGYYFTSSPDDASANYATPDSPELQAKAQALQNELTKQGLPFKHISYHAIKDHLVEEGGAVYPVYLKMNRPFTISEETPYHRGQHDTAIPKGAILTAIVIDHNDDLETALKLEQKLKGAGSTLDAINLITDFGIHHNYAGLALNIIKRSGYDGVIDQSAGKLWHTPDDVFHYIVFNENQAKSAIGNTGKFSLSDSSILYQQPPEYSSVLYQYAGIQAKNADFGKLETAKSLKKQGCDPERIRRLTGWHHWIDDKWRFEIDDSQAMVNSQVFEETRDHYNRIASGHGATQFSQLPAEVRASIQDSYAPSLKFEGSIEEVLNHHTLFNQYPQLKGIKATIEIHPDLAKTEGYMTNGIPPDAEIHIRAKNGRDVMIGMLHELQHGIQNIESFASGGSARNFDQLSNESIHFYQRQLNDINFLLDFADLKTLPLTDAAQQLGSQLSSATHNMTRTNSRCQIEDYAKKIDFKMRSPSRRYHFLAGEYEARDVVHRQDLNASARLKIPPYTLEGNPKEVLEVIFPGEGSNPKMEFSPGAPLGAVLRNTALNNFMILLTQHKNPSTLVHESGHVFMDLFVAESLKPDAPECIKQDYKTLCDYLGNSPDSAFSEDQCEKWARTVEAYFLSGGEDLPHSNVLSRMERIMKEVYQDARELAVELTPEIIEVIDRMFDVHDEHPQIDFSEIAELVNATINKPKLSSGMKG